MSFSRRAFLSGAVTTAAFTGLARFVAAQPDTQSPVPTPTGIQSDVYASEVPGYGPLVRDPAGVFDLPQGFSYRVISRAGEEMDDGLLVPRSMDGMGCFPLDEDRVILVRNHELKIGDAEWSAFGPRYARRARADGAMAYDRYADGRPCPGGTTTLIYNLRSGHTERQHLSLAGTLVNCDGGPTPGGSWLTCEETLQGADGRVGQAHGWVFEVPSRAAGLVQAVPVRAMGRFKHEATATNPRTGVVYLTEDEGDGQGLFYRYLPNDRERLHAGGRLQAMGFKGDREGDTRNWNGRQWSQGDWRETVWIDVAGVDNPHGDLRHRGRAAGAAWVARGEGVFIGGGEMFFTATSGGPARIGQILRYAPSPYEGRADEVDRPGRLQLFVESDDPTKLNMGDNLALSPAGHLMICEDKAVRSGVNYLRGVTPEGRLYTFARNAVPFSSSVGANAELAGICMSPDGSTMFVNVYAPGSTLAITGPWARFRSAA